MGSYGSRRCRSFSIRTGHKEKGSRRAVVHTMKRAATLAMLLLLSLAAVLFVALASVAVAAESVNHFFNAVIIASLLFSF